MLRYHRGSFDLQGALGFPHTQEIRNRQFSSLGQPVQEMDGGLRVQSLVAAVPCWTPVGCHNELKPKFFFDKALAADAA